ncbi:hypothetical protein [Burkholderia pyrrocinia]|uniref:hypothetical protein n=1 Tax=Burkholderia pyrrocinia TaxID=60550 RepID=UPI002AB04824|nr:hypothetical protein [Burkholderia pyrrocinia]
MNNFSENWRRLKSVIAAYSHEHRNANVYSFADHERAKALAVFLAVAELATPTLDRQTVAEILTGRQPWPRVSDTADGFSGVDVSLSLLEELGIVTFFCGWCTVHLDIVRDWGTVDSSVLPILQAIEHLKRICDGQEGYIRPYFSVAVSGIDKASWDLLSRVIDTGLLPELQRENDMMALEPDHRLWDPLSSTYLWLQLRQTLDPNAAFERWIFCQRVNSRWASPIIPEYLEFEDRQVFEQQLIAYLSRDPALTASVTTMWRQVVNEHTFSMIVAAKANHVRKTINSELTHDEIEYMPPPVLASLFDQYPPCPTDAHGDLSFLQSWHRHRHWGEASLFYSRLLAHVVEAGIRIDGQLLAHFNSLDDLFELAESRPILRHALLAVLPTFEHPNYKILLLSRPDTCDVALYYLTQLSLSDHQRQVNPSTKSFDDAYQRLVSHEYLRSLADATDRGHRLLSAIVYLAGLVDFGSRDFSEKKEYRIVLTMLDSLNPDQMMEVVRAFVDNASMLRTIDANTVSHTHYLFLGFWLIEKLDVTGTDLTGAASKSVKETVFAIYASIFENSLQGHYPDLRPSSFLATLPWHHLVHHGETVGALLSLSNDCDDWKRALKYEEQHCLKSASAIRQYLQVLLVAGQPQRLSGDWKRIADRVIEIVRTLGFSSDAKFACLFDSDPLGNEYDLWRSFCQYTNFLEESTYNDFNDRCLPKAPLHHLLVLLENTTRVSRASTLKEVVARRPSTEMEGTGLADLEKIFVSAFAHGQADLAKEALDAATKWLQQDRFANTKNHHVLHACKVWASYGYKCQLLTLSDSLQDQPEEFQKSAHAIPIPHSENRSPYDVNNERRYWSECERFRRYVVAAVYCNTNPGRCVTIMERLVSETKDGHHGFLLFRARNALYQITTDDVALRNALSQFMNLIDSVDIDTMPIPWVSLILDTCCALRDSERTDEFWSRLGPEQRDRREVLVPYCRALIARGDVLIANQLVHQYVRLNGDSAEGLGLDELIVEVERAMPERPSIIELIGVVNEGAQRTIGQLSKHYSQIISKSFEDYVAITAPPLTPDEFLRDIVVEVVDELLLRKKNLQMHATAGKDRTSRKVTQEDLINDWFTSLFDKRMAEARIGVRDQKRGGQSASGKGPGEIDGYIVDASNRRLAIFEAFRLFSIDTNVIGDHLNKIAGYDHESLSPAFIVAYCDVADFQALIDGYAAFVGAMDYVGFTRPTSTDLAQIATWQRSAHRWVGVERRHRGYKEIVIYHVLLNMHESGDAMS